MTKVDPGITALGTAGKIFSQPRANHLVVNPANNNKRSVTQKAYRILRSMARRGRGSRARSTSSPRTRRTRRRGTAGSTARICLKKKCE